MSLNQRNLLKKNKGRDLKQTFSSNILAKTKRKLVKVCKEIRAKKRRLKMQKLQPRLRTMRWNHGPH